MSVVTNTMDFPHVRATPYVDEHVDQFDAFAISWNGTEAIHLTFGRNTLTVASSRMEHYDDKPAETKTGRVEIFRLDVAGIAMPIAAAKQLAETLSKMVADAESRMKNDEQV